MNKKLTVLIILLIVSWSSFSQTPSITTSPCTVPCYTLRNALKVKERAELLDSQVVILRDSVLTYQKLILSKDTVIRFKDSQIVASKTNEQHYKNIVKIQDKTIEDLKYDKAVSYVFLGISFLLSLVIAI